MGNRRRKNRICMGGRGDLIDKIKSFILRYFGDKQGAKKRKYIIAIALTGVLLIIISNMIQPSTKPNPDLMDDMDVATKQTEEPESAFMDDVKEMEVHYENTLQAMLNEITGVSEVEIMVNIDSTNVQVYEKDLIVGTQTTDELDKNGGERQVEDETKETKVVYVRKGDQEVPILVQTKKPEVRGVFIIAKGAGNATIKKWIVESVSKVLDVPTYRISVMPK